MRIATKIKSIFSLGQEVFIYTTGLYGQRGSRGAKSGGEARCPADSCQGSLPYPVTRHVTTHVPMSPPSPVIRPLSIPETWVRNNKSFNIGALSRVVKTVEVSCIL